MLKRLLPYFKYLKPVRLQFVGGILFGVLYGIASGFGLPFMSAKVFPVIFSSEAGAAQPTFWVLAGAVALLPIAFLVRGVSGFFNVYLIRYCGTHALQSIQKSAFARIQSLPLAFFEKHRSGDLLARLTSDCQVLQATLTLVANDLVRQPITLIGALGALIVMSFMHSEVVFILLCLGMIPVCVFPIRYVGKKLLHRAEALQKETGNITSLLSENLGAAREVRAYNLEAQQNTLFETRLNSLFRYTMKIVKYKQSLAPAIEVLSAIGISGAILYAALKGVSLEAVVPLIFALYMAYEPIKKLGGIHSQLKQADASLDRIEGILHAPDTVPEPANPVPLPGAVTGALKFQNVSFAYNPAEDNANNEAEHITEYVLKDINLNIPAGETVAFVGPSGAGKSTLVSLVPRFYNPTSGQIYLDGVDISTLSKHTLRGNIALVSQHPVLFNSTLAENIALGMGKPGASQADIEHAAQRAGAHSFITEFEDGYATMCGERGARLSGGQAQRIALARAFLKNAPILILDEATSALDTESETLIQNALGELTQGKTVLMIAHRFSTLKLASRIVLMEAGRVAAQGTHAELYETNTLYRSLYDKQTLA